MTKKINRKFMRRRAELINSILKVTEDKFGENQTTLLSSKNISSIVSKTITTYSPELDLILARDSKGNFGIPVGRIIGISGEEACGKTTLTIMILKAVQKMGGLSILVESEHAFDPIYAGKLGLNLDDLLFAQPDYLEQALDMITEYTNQFKEAKEIHIAETGENWDVPMVIVFDSIAGSPPKAELDAETFEDDQARALHARKLSKFFRTISGRIAKEQIALVCTNQTKTDTEVRYGNKSAEIGGKALKFHASIRLDLKRIGFIKPTKDSDPIGIETRAKTIKNKVMLPFKEAVIPIIFGEGVSYTRSSFNFLTKHKIISRRGATYTLDLKNESIVAVGKEKFLRKLSKKENRKYLKKLVRKAMNEVYNG